MSDLRLGSQLGGRYHVVDKVGSGAFADVYQAKHLAIDSLDVAIKVLRGVDEGRENVSKRFAQEIWAAGAVRSPFVVQVHDAGTTEDGRPWLAMEYVAGPTLQRVLRSGRPLTDALVARWLAGILRGLVAIHSCGLIHRDLKPGNILLSWPASDTWPTPKVTDFGIAKVMEAVSNAPREIRVDPTITGTVVCTPRYAAPEQLLQAPEPASDLYALGLIGIALLTARNAFEEHDAAVLMARHLAPDPIALPERVAESPLAPIIARAIAKPLDARFRTAMEMLDALEPIERALAANPPDRAELDHLESLFPAGARTHRDLRRSEDARITLPNRMRSPLGAVATPGPAPATLDTTDTLHPPAPITRSPTGSIAPSTPDAPHRLRARRLALGALLATGIGLSVVGLNQRGPVDPAEPEEPTRATVGTPQHEEAPAAPSAPLASPPVEPAASAVPAPAQTLPAASEPEPTPRDVPPVPAIAAGVDDRPDAPARRRTVTPSEPARQPTVPAADATREEPARSRAAPQPATAEEARRGAGFRTPGPPR